MQYYALRSENALSVLESVRTGADIDMQVIELRGSGPKFDEQSLKGLADELYEVKKGYQPKLRSRDPAGGEFEAAACAIVHKNIPADPNMLADAGFWLWLSITQFASLVDWRHGGEEGKASPANFGIGGIVENLLYRMWLRADIGFEPTALDPYELARKGDQDFWRSHIFRQGYGRCRRLSRMLIRYQFPTEKRNGPTLKTLEIRELAKRLRRLDPNLMYDYLDEREIFELIQKEALRAKKAPDLKKGLAGK